MTRNLGLDLLHAGLKVAVCKGYPLITREDVAKICNVTPSMINHHYDNIQTFRRKVLKCACENKIHAIIVQAIVLNDASVMTMTTAADRINAVKQYFRGVI